MHLSQAAERYLRSSGLRYTIVRPGGLRSEPASEVGQLIVSREDSLFGLDSDPGRAISRDTVRLCDIETLLNCPCKLFLQGTCKCVVAGLPSMLLLLWLRGSTIHWLGE
jgi:hypothetical protein